MSNSDLAKAHADSARMFIRQGGSSADPTSRAAAEALLAIFYQLRHMNDHSITLKGAVDLTDAMHTLSHKLPDQ